MNLAWTQQAVSGELYEGSGKALKAKTFQELEAIVQGTSQAASRVLLQAKLDDDWNSAPVARASNVVQDREQAASPRNFLDVLQKVIQLAEFLGINEEFVRGLVSRLLDQWFSKTDQQAAQFVASELTPGFVADKELSQALFGGGNFLSKLKKVRELAEALGLDSEVIMLLLKRLLAG